MSIGLDRTTAQSAAHENLLKRSRTISSCRRNCTIAYTDHAVKLLWAVVKDAAWAERCAAAALQGGSGEAGECVKGMLESDVSADFHCRVQTRGHSVIIPPIA